MLRRFWILGALCACGCITSSPERVFVDATEAFAVGDIAAGIEHFSTRLRAERPTKALEAYYADPDRRRGVEFLLRDHRFLVLEEHEDRAVAQVTWSTGRTEPVYFVREEGHWKLDLGPDRASARESLNEGS